MTAPDPFATEVVRAVTAHMNGDHADDCTLIARALGGVTDAEEATMVGYDEHGARFDAVAGGRRHEVRVPWSTPITDRASIRAGVVRMYHDACAAAGIEPRAAAEH